MQICGIICEFNPFHNGHKYLIKQAKKITGAKIACLMSGNFVQRGTPAILDKYSRAKDAIQSGADIVLEFPTVFACSNAENFAFGAIKILDSLNVSSIAFGIEETSLETLQKIAEIKLTNSKNFQNSFKNEIENGINFNTALKRAIAKEFENRDEIIEILSKPNNILAIEYLTAIRKLGSKIQAIAIPRIDNGYNSTKQKGQFLSASGIREKIYNGEDVSLFMPNPPASDEIFSNIFNERFDALLLNKIRNTSPKELEKFYDYSEGIEFRIKSKAEQCSSIEELINQTSTPRYRQQRVNKLVLYPSLNISKKIVQLAKQTKPAIKVLAINKSSKELLSCINKKKISLIVTNKDYDNLTKSQKQIIDCDLISSNLYSTATKKHSNNDKKTGTLFL